MTKPIDIGQQLAIAHRFAFVADIFDGFTEGLDDERRQAGIDWARRGSVSPDQELDLVSLFSAPHVAFNDEGRGKDEPECEPVTEALRDIERIGGEAEALAAAHAWQNDLDKAPIGETVLVWWPKVQLDNEGNLTEQLVGGIQAVSERMGVGLWNEPDCTQAAGLHFDDDWEYGATPLFWKLLGADPVQAAPTEGPSS